MKKLLLLVTMLFISVSIYSFDFSTGDNTGKVTIFRPQTFAGLNMIIEVMLNQTIMFEIEKNEMAEITLNPGVYLIHVQHDIVPGLGQIKPYFEPFKVVVEEGDDIYIELVPFLGAAKENFKFKDKIKNRDSYTAIEDLIWVRGDE